MKLLSLSDELDWDLDGPDSTPASSHVQAAGGLAAILGKLQGLKPFPETAQRLLTLILDPEHDTAKVVEIIENDPGLTAKVLRLINSGAFGLRRECSSVQQGTVLLGSRQIAEVASAQLAMAQFEGTGKAGRTVRDHSLQVALIARRLVTLRPSLKAVDLFTPALLHDVGKLLQLQADAATYEGLLAQATPGPGTLHLIEQAQLGYDHATLAGHVMRDWQLPDDLCSIVTYHHDLPAAVAEGELVGEAVATLQLADHLQYVIPQDLEGSDERFEAAAATEAAAHLGIDSDQIAGQWSGLAAALEAS